MSDTNRPSPPRRAVALHYDGKTAPRVTAKGAGLVADKILALAREHHIPLREDTNLVALLARLELGEFIPENLYKAVAQVIAYAYLVSGKHAERREK
jgi:flagellar biosynthesis protein